MSYDHFKSRREAANLIIADTYPHSVTPDEYIARLGHFGEDGDGEAMPTIPPVYATCLCCYGDGRTPNPQWSDTEENREPEAIECDLCHGGGFVRIALPPPPVAIDDDMPF